MMKGRNSRLLIKYNVIEVVLFTRSGTEIGKAMFYYR